jgi:class 3 adenylate cyclase
MPSAIRKWLTDLGVDIYADAFEKNDIDLDIAADLTEDDLKTLGVASLGHRRKLLRAIAVLNTAVTDDARTSAPSALHRVHGGADRRQLTVLFCDLADSTALSTRLDPELYRELIRTYQDACAATIARYDGYVARYMGDGVLAYFGWPHSHEDDAERAVRAFASGSPPGRPSLATLSDRARLRRQPRRA